MRFGALSISTSNKRLITCIIKLTSEKSEWIFLRTDIPNFISKSINSRKHFLLLSCIFNPPSFHVLTSLYLLTPAQDLHTLQNKRKRGLVWREGWFYSRVEVVVLPAATHLRTTFGRERRNKGFFSDRYIYVCVHCISGLGSLVIFLSPRGRIFMREGAICVVSGRVF